MSMFGSLVKKYFESRELKYTELQAETGTRLRLGFDCKNMPSIQVNLIIEDDGHMAVRSWNYCSVPENKKNDIYKICSDMNHKYRWVKFYVDEQDNTVSLEDDAILSLDNCGEESTELTIRMVRIADEAYPVFMKALFN